VFQKCPKLIFYTLRINDQVLLLLSYRICTLCIAATIVRVVHLSCSSCLREWMPLLPVVASVVYKVQVIRKEEMSGKKFI
jgi:hypothetical protein